MKSTMKKLFGFSSMLLLSTVSAFADAGQDTIAAQQKSLFEKLDSLNDAVLGLRVNGSAKAGFLTSMASSDQFAGNSPTQESQAYTTVNLVFTAHPSAETEVRVETRLHKDWQNAYEENNNPVIGHWFSYDGLILNKHLAFNLGYMRVGYTPYTLYTPQPNLLQEPEVFAEARTEAMADRNLDTTSRRLLQGLNVDYHSGAVGVIDDIHAQATGARLRNIAKKNDESFFDFDWSDRYLFGGRLGVEAYGASVGVNYVEVFDRKKSFSSHDLDFGDTVALDDNKVFSGEIAFDSRKLLPELPVSFGLTGELAASWWSADKYYLSSNSTDSYSFKKGAVPNAAGGLDSVVYLAATSQNKSITVSEPFEDVNGMGFYVEPYVRGDIADFHLDLSLRYLQNDEDFWSELASASNFNGNSVILNSNGLYADSTYSGLVSAFGMSSMENLYFQVYNSNPYNATNIQSSYNSNVLSANNEESSYLYSRLYNNYKNVHVYRNGYTASTIKRLERNELALLMNGSLDMALPMGLATPDRKGFSVAFDGDWNSAINLNVRFSQYNQDAIDNKYTQYAVGAGVRLDQVLANFGINDIFGNENKALIQASYSHSEENAYFKRKSNRIMGGISAGVWGPIGIQFGVEQFKLEYGNALLVTNSAAITKAEELLVRIGPKIKIAPASYLSIQYGLLTDKVSFVRATTDALGNPAAVSDELSIDKNVIMADVTVAF